MDTVDQQTRSRIMASVGQKNTGAEMTLRKALFQAGFRYRLHVKGLPGTPDLVFPKFKAVVFVHGCYWHSHGCYKSTKPRTNDQFWLQKFETNRVRDARKSALLVDQGWRVLTVWECAVLGKTSLSVDDLAIQVTGWLQSSSREGVIGPVAD